MEKREEDWTSAQFILRFGIPYMAVIVGFIYFNL
jgi:hypothetical protein